MSARYNRVRDERTGEVSSDVPGWTVTYPATCNGHLGDIGFVASRGYGGSDFVHFDRGGRAYGYPLTVAARERIERMRRDYFADRCGECGALGGAHGMVHVRYGNGGGGNRPCSQAERVSA